MYHNSIYLSPKRNTVIFLMAFIAAAVFYTACNSAPKPASTEIVEEPEKMDEKVKGLITKSLAYALSDSGRVDDSITLAYAARVQLIYKQYNNEPVWCRQQNWLPQADSLFYFIQNSRLFGLFPEDYHAAGLASLRTRFFNDSLVKNEKKDAALWSRADLMLTDAMIGIINDIKMGRLPNDSVTLRKDSVLTDSFLIEKMRAIISGNPLKVVIASLEPAHKEYHELKAGIKDFLAKADFKEYPLIEYPDKNKERLMAAVRQRLFESGYLDSATHVPDSLQMISILKNFQKDRGLMVDGVLGSQTIRELNATDREKFYRIAITLDRYKLLPEKMPEKYIWVNIPSYTLKLVSGDSAVIRSRVVVGKPITRTPVLNSFLSEMITYPQWTIPQSIIVKEILPALKRNPGYLAKKGYSLWTYKNEEVDPYTVDWSKYNKGVPYRIIQGSGDANALGVLKFNFNNKYAVYLHDTNQRFYFGLDSRALSHGCVRVQEWRDMAFYLIRNDSLQAAANNNKRYTPADSVKRWLAIKEKHSVPVRNRVAIFIRYYTVGVSNGKIEFYEDIYNEDKMLREKYFSGKL